MRTKMGQIHKFWPTWSKLNLSSNVVRRAARLTKALTGGEVVDRGPGVSHPAFSCRAYPTPATHPIYPPHCVLLALFLITLPHFLLLFHSSWIFCHLSQDLSSCSSCPITHSATHHHPLRGSPPFLLSFSCLFWLFSLLSALPVKAISALNENYVTNKT